MSCFGAPLEIAIILTIVSSVSIVISALIIILCVLGEVLDELTSSIVVYMAINDIIRSIALIATGISPDSISPLCKAIGFLVCFTLISDLFWAFSISYTLYQVIIKDNYNFKSTKKFWFILSYPILAFSQALPFITDSYGFDGTLCTLKDEPTSNIWRFFNYYLPCWAITAFMIFAYFRMYYKLKEKRQLDAAIDLIMHRGYIYPLIMALMIVLLTVYRIIQEFGKWCGLEKFGISLEYILAAHGLLNAIAFFSNSNVRRALKEKYNYKFRSISESSVGVNLIFQQKDDI